MKSLSLLLFAATGIFAVPAQTNRWTLTDDGGIAWTPKPGDAHEDNIEMSGLRVSTIVTYGIDKSGHFSVSRQLVWPMLRFLPVSTRSHLSLTFGEDAAPRLFFDRASPRNEAIARVSHREGVMRVEGSYGRDKEIAFVRTIFPSVDNPFILDRTELTNRSGKEMLVEVERNERRIDTDGERGVDGAYVASSRILGAGTR